MTDTQEIRPTTQARPRLANEGGYAVFEVVRASEVAQAIESGHVAPDATVYVKRGIRTDEDGREEAIHAQAAEDDREGTRYAATTARYFLEKTPKKDVKVQWS